MELLVLLLAEVEAEVMMLLEKMVEMVEMAE